jgi:ribosomal protein L22
MGRNAQRRRAPKNLRKLMSQIRRKPVSQALSVLAQEYQASHPDTIFNRATRRGNKTAKWYR